MTMRFFVLLLFLTASLQADPGRQYTGSYQPTFSSQGTIEHWYLYDDGTMEGDWVTANGSISMNVKGTYKTQDGVTIFQASGQILLPTKEVSIVTVSGTGKFGPGGGSGTYVLHLDTKNFKDDYGTWTVTSPGAAEMSREDRIFGFFLFNDLWFLHPGPGKATALVYWKPEGKSERVLQIKLWFENGKIVMAEDHREGSPQRNDAFTYDRGTITDTVTVSGEKDRIFRYEKGLDGEFVCDVPGWRLTLNQTAKNTFFFLEKNQETGANGYGATLVVSPEGFPLSREEASSQPGLLQRHQWFWENGQLTQIVVSAGGFLTTKQEITKDESGLITSIRYTDSQGELQGTREIEYQ